ncbi:MAG: cytochrome c [Chromatiales bacterium]
MMMRVILMLFILLPGLSQALNIENGKRINRTCALCHGDYGQGTPGTLSPRLAGLPASYLAKELRYYRSGKRNYAPMIIASSIRKMSDEDIDDISEYLAGVNLRNLNLPKIPKYQNGDKEQGKRIFKQECKGCHRRTGLGKAKKGIPPVAGQYGSYIFGQIKKFQAKHRDHDDDPEDDTFAEYEDAELDNIIAYLTSLPAHAPLTAAEKFTIDTESVAGMAGAESMAGMVSGQETSLKGMSGSDEKVFITGRFRVTPMGEIVLIPLNQDMRSIAGLSGDFKITPTGILFIPN